MFQPDQGPENGNLLEGVTWDDRTLGNAGRTVSPTGTRLEESVPMLSVNTGSIATEVSQRDFRTYNTGAAQHRSVNQLVDDIDFEVIIFPCNNERTGEISVGRSTSGKHTTVLVNEYIRLNWVWSRDLRSSEAVGGDVFVDNIHVEHRSDVGMS